MPSPDPADFDLAAAGSADFDSFGSSFDLPHSFRNENGRREFLPELRTEACLTIYEKEAFLGPLFFVMISSFER